VERSSSPQRPDYRAQSSEFARLSTSWKIAFVRRQASGTKYVTSVCTGAFALGAAGLLRGHKATTHWALTDLLALVGAREVSGREGRQPHHRGWRHVWHRRARCQAEF
jgi:DJ-1/PfpI family protein